ncbi:MJ1477/TM1410 family putative glycoside hydrolase [Methylobacterium oxalidis]|uniref:Glycoside-hydrolase family GH114 TIM-barrel domain-containing protein n=1 Tax=Methylobacterium oxalidis TaxID=944322 RepID=A0A512J6L1_9HYPH|nr:MJ1477/TM1410 family putative glycoside hydrolase [Methylobacterium oxalidis]GEP05499.1 hypothetical protein MOX02_35370 [Methylobacterium oxalidis]GJE31027.1 hypothetical protein LDDCCGHA_1199 [Methylobacterium oxalidis]GLS65608.1 hypothetical protein GCM10007888_39900 [Methylobacterium oxalidis]
MAVSRWADQSQNANPAEIAASPFDLLIIDRDWFDGSAVRSYSASEVTQMETRPGAEPRLMLAYMSVGEASDWRLYWNSAWDTSPPSWLGPENPNWPGSFQVRYWEAGWQALLLGSPGAYLDKILAAGFGGVFLDLVDIYQSGLAAERPDPAADMVALVGRISAYAKARDPNFKIYVNNGEELLLRPAYMAAIDGINKESLFYGVPGPGIANDPAMVSYSLGLLDRASDAGKTVLNIEYVTSETQIADVLARGGSAGIVSYIAERSLATLDQTGTTGADTLTGGIGANRLTGIQGDDLLTGGLGRDILDGGSGSDTASFAEKTAAVSVTLAGSMVVTVSVGGAAEDTLRNVENVRGGSGADALTGDGLANTLTGNNGADTLKGMAGNDTLIGGAGNDAIDGGAGTDLVVFSGSRAQYQITGSGGSLTVADTRAGADGTDQVLNAERIQFADRTYEVGELVPMPPANAAPTLTIGFADADGILRRGETTTVTFDFSEAVTGFTRSDVALPSGLGTLGTLVQDAADPTLYRASLTPASNAAGDLTVSVGSGYQDLSGLGGTGAARALLVNTLAVTAGSAGNNAMTGTNQANTLDGLAGQDTLSGRGGADWLFGGEGNDSLSGGDGNDRLFGGAGDDGLTGGAGVDLFVVNQAAFGNDRISDFRPGTDDIDLRALHLAFADITVRPVAEGTLIGIGAGTILLAGVQPASVAQGDFLI